MELFPVYNLQDEIDIFKCVKQLIEKRLQKDSAINVIIF